MNLISLDNVGKALTDAPLFESVTLGIDEGERIGFVGRNGSGKSTFLRLLAGELEPDTGSVSRNRALRMSVVEQRPDFETGATVESYLGQAATDRDQLEREAVARRYRSFCAELGLEDMSQPLADASGGMVRKASLARSLAQGANFLLLDEPTNHLDLDTVEWLEALLKASPFGFLMVTHDRYFLDAVCTAVMEIDARRVYKYPGTYAEFLERQAGRQEARERAEQKRNPILRVELEWLKRGPRARTGKDKGRKARLEDLIGSAERKDASLEGFSSAHRRLGGKILELHGVAKSYGGTPVIQPFTYTFRKGERIGIIGPNGSGKTTFLKLVSGQLAPDSGKAVKGATTVFGHFDQTGSYIDGKLSVIEYMKEPAERVLLEKGGSVPAEQFLERFLFPRAMQSLPLERLSGGEFRRLCLVRLLASAPNFLLLDEPTNDFDLDTTRLLEEFLSDFKGCLIVVSHDRALLTGSPITCSCSTARAGYGASRVITRTTAPCAPRKPRGNPPRSRSRQRGRPPRGREPGFRSRNAGSMKASWARFPRWRTRSGNWKRASRKPPATRPPSRKATGVTGSSRTSSTPSCAAGKSWRAGRGNRSDNRARSRRAGRHMALLSLFVYISF